MIRKLFATAAVALLVATAGIVAPAAAGAATSGHYFNLTRIYFDSPGPDNGTNASINREYFVVKNITGSTRAVTNWTVSDRSGHRYKFPSLNVPAGSHVTVHTGVGRFSYGVRYWGQNYYVWNNSGDGATLRGPAGTVWDTCSYTAASDPVTNC